MSLILDLIILILIAANLFAGWKNGFVRTVLHTCATLISLVIAYLFSPTLAVTLRDSYFNEAITGSVRDGLSSLMEAGGETISLETLFADAPEAFVNLLARFGVELETVKEQFASAIESGSASLLEDVTRYIADPITDLVSRGVAFLALFLGGIVVLNLLCLILDALCRLPALKTVNAALGMILGAVTGLLMAWGLSTALVALMPALSHLWPDVISESVIDSTLLVKLLAGIKLSLGL